MRHWYVLLLVLLPGLLAAQNLTVLEYYYDTDPGEGNGIQVSLPADSTADVTFSTDPSGLTPGFHQVFFRVRDENGKWGIAQAKGFILASQDPGVKQSIHHVEYFMDEDPGFGNGTGLSLTPDTLDDREMVLIPGDLESGFHRFYLRYRDVTGGWSLPVSRGFLLSEHSPLFAADVAGLEYYFDTDPGQGNGISLPVEPDSVIQLNPTLILESVGPGFHRVYLRAVTDLGLWGLPMVKPVLVERIKSDSTDLIELVETWFDTDPGFGNGDTVAIRKGVRTEDTLRISLADIPYGIHNLGVRVRSQSGAWSLSVHRQFVKQEMALDEPGLINGLEYFTGTDPGEGLGRPVAVGPASVVNETLLIDLSDLGPGFHVIRIRARDEEGNWSHVATRPVWMHKGSGGLADVTGIDWSVQKQGVVVASGRMNATHSAPVMDRIEDLPLTGTVVDSTYEVAFTAVNPDGLRSQILKQSITIRAFKNILLSWEQVAARDSVIAILDAAGLEYDSINRAGGDTCWVNWKTVLWDEPDGLTPAQRTAIRRFTDQGNNRSLIIAGENVVSGHAQSGNQPDTSFIHRVLRAGLVSADANGGSASWFIMGAGLSGGISGLVAASAPDAIRPIRGAEAAATWLGFGPDTAAGVIYNGPTNTAVFGFGFHQISSIGSDRFFAGIPDWIDQSGGWLPVELSGFSGGWTGSEVLLTWQTQTETGNAGFTINYQKPGDTEWKSAGFVSGKGTTRETTTYQFRHRWPYQKGEAFYRLVQTDLTGEKHLSEAISVLIGPPADFRLYQNYPNPFNGETVIRFDLPVHGRVHLEIYNLLGQRVRQLVHGELEGDCHTIRWDGKTDAGDRVASGQYFYLLMAGNRVEVRRMVVLR